MATHRTQRQLAAAVGVAVSTLAGYLKRPDFPASIPRRGPWTDEQAAAVKAWRANLQEDRSDKAAQPPAAGKAVHSPDFGTQRLKADALLKAHRARAAKVQADLAEGAVIERELYDRSLVGLTQMFVAILDELDQGLAHELDGDPGKNERVIRRATADARRRLLAERRIRLADLEQVAAAKDAQA